MNRNRVAKLERVARKRPCPGCGRVDPLPVPNAAEPDYDRLGRAEQEELGVLIQAMTVLPCPRCGRSAHDFTRVTDEQLNRALALLRKLFGLELPVPGNVLEKSK